MLANRNRFEHIATGQRSGLLAVWIALHRVDKPRNPAEAWPREDQQDDEHDQTGLVQTSENCFTLRHDDDSFWQSMTAEEQSCSQHRKRANRCQRI